MRRRRAGFSLDPHGARANPGLRGEQVLGDIGRLSRMCARPALPHRYRNVLWDWNGTLLDDVDHAVAVMNVLLGEHGLPRLDRDRYRRVFDFPVRDYYERIGFDLTGGAFPKLGARFVAAFEEGLGDVALFDDARASLEHVRGMGCSQFVLSNTEDRALERMLRRYAIRDHFEEHAGNQNDLAEGKTEIGARLISTHGLVRGETLLIGDTVHDYDVANALGVDCALVTTGHHDRARLISVDTPTFDDLSSLTAALL